MAATTTPRRTTEPFRQEHVAIKEHLRHMSQMIQSIPAGAPEVQKHSMTKLVEALKGHILPHAESRGVRARGRVAGPSSRPLRVAAEALEITAAEIAAERVR